MIKRKKVLVAAVGSILLATAAYAATQLAVKAPIALSDGGLGDKPKIQRSGDGTGARQGSCRLSHAAFF